MTEPFARLRRFLRELKRRKVYRVAAGYLVAAFIVLQLAGLAADAFGFPGWFQPMVWVMAGLGFPLAVVLAWAFEVTPEGVRRTPEAERAEEAEAAEAGARTGYKLLLGLGLVAAAVAGGWYLIGGGGGKSPEVTEGTVAVLPFQVSGSASEQWRDGMVSLLSTGLDGAAGLRAIPDQTVLATWEQSGPKQPRATVEQSLAAARRIGARYGVVGTVTGLGSELQLSAGAYETTSGERLGQVEVTGTPDSMTALAGELTRRVLGLLAAETGERLGAADLASVMTRSDTALRAFLSGERHLRDADWESATEDYEAAIRADSGFALPYARLGRIGIWHGAFRGHYLRRARELSGDLPERQRRLIRAAYLAQIERRTLAAADSLRRLTEEYPDDPFVWESLGELVAHSEIPAGPPEVETTHERAVELDPGFAPNYDHYVEAAFHLQRDSAVVARRIAAVPNEDWRKLYRLGFEVLYGDSTRRQQAVATYDTVSIPDAPWPVWSPYLAPQNAAADSVIRRVLEREDVVRSPLFTDPVFARVLFGSALRQGQVHRALAHARRWGPDTDGIACGLAQALTLGYPVPDSTAAHYLDPDTLHDKGAPGRLSCTGFYLIERGRGDELEGLIQRLREAVDTTAEAGPSAGQLKAVVRELRGYRAWNRGELDRAARLWNRSNEFGQSGAIWRGDLYRNLGQLERAEGWYLAAWLHPVAHERLGRLYEGMGQPEKAASAYRRFIEAWEEADPELQDRVEAARKRLKKLTGSQSKAND